MHNESDQPVEQPDLGRRRFTRAGVSGSVLLGSLASSPVLGQTVPYHCTMSGNLSGNVSYRVGAADKCNTLGGNLETWRTASLWPSPYVKGTLPDRQGNNACNYSGTTVRGTEFGSVFADRFFQWSDGQGSNSVCKVTFETAQPADTKEITYRRATLLQVLTIGASTDSSADFEFAAIAIASLLSASNKVLYPKYPLSAAQVVSMYNAVVANGSWVHSSASPGWDRAKVAGYLAALMPYTPRNFTPLML